MRITTSVAAALCCLAVTAAAPVAAQGGGKQHHHADTTQTVAPDRTLDGGQSVSPILTLTSDASPAGERAVKTSAEISNSETGASEVFAPASVRAFDLNPVGFKWALNDKRGWVVLMLNAAGSWELSGSYDNKGPARELEVVVALKDKDGRVYLFHGATRAPKGKHAWSMTSGNGVIATNYTTLERGFEIRGAYRLPTSAEAKAYQSTSAFQVPCRTEATVAAGWGLIWTWAAPHRECYQFNGFASL